MSQSHFTLSFPLKSLADAKAIAEELPPLMPGLFEAEDAIGTIHYSRFTLQDANFWIQNPSVEWKEAEAPFHTIARLTLLPKSCLRPDEAEATYVDVTANSTPDSTPFGSINRAGRPAKVASRKARMR